MPVPPGTARDWIKFTSSEDTDDPNNRGPRRVEVHTDDLADPDDLMDQTTTEEEVWLKPRFNNSDLLDVVDPKDFEMADPDKISHRDIDKMFEDPREPMLHQWLRINKTYRSLPERHTSDDDPALAWESAQVSTWVGDSNRIIPESIDGLGTSASFQPSYGLCADTSGNLFVVETVAHKVRMISPSGEVTTLAGTGDAGLVDGTAARSKFRSPYQIAHDKSSGSLYIADSGNRCIRRISPDRRTVTTFFDGENMPQYNQDPRCLWHAYGIACDSKGNVFVGDNRRRMIMKFSPQGSPSHFAGTGFEGYLDGPGSMSQFGNIFGIATDRHDNLYVGDGKGFNDYMWDKVRRISPDGNVISYAGNRLSGNFLGAYADGPKEMAEFHDPYALGVDEADNLYVSDTKSYVVRKVTPDGTAGTLSGIKTFPGWRDGEAGTATFFTPHGFAFVNGDVLVLDMNNRNIRKISTFKNWTIENRDSAPELHESERLMDAYFPGNSIEEIPDVREQKKFRELAALYEAGLVEEDCVP